MRHWAWLLLVLAVASGAVWGQQGVIGDVLAGNLVKPKVGQWAWYEVLDSNSGQRFALRQAVVGEEKVGRKAGYWVELEIVPPVGYRSVYKMLLTGPASEPKHVHRVIVREGLTPPVEAPMQEGTEDEPEHDKDGPETKRDSLGMEKLTTAGGVIEAEHLRLTIGDKTSEVWVNDKVRPLGIVRMVSTEGQLVLRRYGEGGDDARSVMDDDPLAGQGVQKPKIEVRVEGEDE